MADILTVRAFVFILLLFPQTITMWTDYHTVNVLAYTRMTGNGSMDQAVVVLVNETVFAYFDQAKNTFVLRPSATAGFSVLETRDSKFCLWEVLKGFTRQAEYLKKFREETRSSKPLLARPSVNMYTQFPEEQGKTNMLYCYATEFYPGDIEINFFLNGVMVKGETSDLMYKKDWTFRVYKYMNITPTPGNEYICEVKHSSMTEPKLTVWRPELSESHPYWAYTPVGVLLGTIVSILIFRKTRNTQS
ncbi:HLA class II histocompatibility antigen, DP beta 1 chain isoform X1 [Xyrauchen texanus]|uniref:HLA class II histocompatibility antigen, DP beta 1 chain isoform X1 n=1 Tax=Xyrauchen texanus TaxID=154827 RepID=UPI0022429DF7|nr:HLA class II histocompatibility antigen, DP beta 1 chain isoform X1 [Xyrauchen texanus]